MSACDLAEYLEICITEVRFGFVGTTGEQNRKRKRVNSCPFVAFFFNEMQNFRFDPMLSVKKTRRQKRSRTKVNENRIPIETLLSKVIR